MNRFIGREYLDESKIFTASAVETSISQLQLAIVAELRPADHTNFWDKVIFRSTNGKVARIPREQAPHIADWIKANWHWFAESFSTRQKIQLRYYMMQLEGKGD